eukprot:CAMPEP_0206137472 /NCGR_PEP_ID=MMETSP1473-20131121/2591_1 /ASSEMBLY_ACC=CAM_ASM_001109 /TAXON_ID=1461547 /ORGANISM="Stichococcus sp, Strain RCC1054" /LENGTH=107 /DNA_ID=CAMNT_0053530571 /DNA_START=269 /DNA_END=589 /DNA_ORIENTATION=-
MKEEPESAGQRLAAWPGPSAKSAEILRSPSALLSDEQKVAIYETIKGLRRDYTKEHRREAKLDLLDNRERLEEALHRTEDVIGSRPPCSIPGIAALPPGQAGDSDIP